MPVGATPEGTKPEVAKSRGAMPGEPCPGSHAREPCRGRTQGPNPRNLARAAVSGEPNPGALPGGLARGAMPCVAKPVGPCTTPKPPTRRPTLRAQAA